MSYVVKLEYFKRSGKWYESGKYISEKEALYGIWDEVRAMRSSGNLPGLVKGAGSEFIISVDVPGHPHEHPHLIV